VRKKTWQQAEDQCCKDFGAKLTPRSGAGFVLKGDCISNSSDPNDKRMFEVKSSTRKDINGHFITLSADWFETVKRHAFASGRDPYVYLYLGDPPHSFLYVYDPFFADMSDGIVVNNTKKVYLKELDEIIPLFIVNGEAWRICTDD